MDSLDFFRRGNSDTFILLGPKNFDLEMLHLLLSSFIYLSFFLSIYLSVYIYNIIIFI